MPARALFHTAPRCVEIRELPTPRPAAGEVIVNTVCSGISGGTERLVYRGEVPADLALDDTIGALGGLRGGTSPARRRRPREEGAAINRFVLVAGG